MRQESRLTAGILLGVSPTVIYGGVSLVSLFIDKESGYVQNPLRKDLWRAARPHAGVMLRPSLGFCRRTGSLLDYAWSRIVEENEQSDQEMMLKSNK